MDYTFSIEDDMNSISSKLFGFLLDSTNENLSNSIYEKCMRKAEWAYHRLQKSSPADKSHEKEKS